MYIAKFKNGTVYTEQNGVWDNCPRAPIVRLELTLPVNLQQILPDGSVKAAPAPTVSLEGYDKYYFANIARSTILSSGNGRNFSVGDMAPELLAKTIVGLDYKHNFVLQIIVWKNASIETKRHPLDKWTLSEGIAEHALHDGIIKD